MKEKIIRLSDEKIREILWASHPCDMKYGDDGELQCNRIYGHGNPIDFKRDDWGNIGKGIARHTRVMIEQAKAEVAREMIEIAKREVKFSLRRQLLKMPSVYEQRGVSEDLGNRLEQSFKDKWLKESK